MYIKMADFINYLLLFHGLSCVSAVDFLFNSFASDASNLTLVGDARVDGSVVRLTNDSNYYSSGRAFYPTRLRLGGGGSVLSSFSTSFIFSILPEIDNSPGFGLAFVLSNSTSLPDALSGQYFGVFSNATHRAPGPLLVIEFDTGRNPEFNDPDGNHVGIDLNFIESSVTKPVGFYRANGSSPAPQFVPLDMRSGSNIRAWIEFDGPRFQINVTVAPAQEPRPRWPLISFSEPAIANYVAPEMFVGFSASKVKWVEAQRVLAWSLTDTGGTARDLNTSDLPLFLPPSPPASSSSPSAVVIVCVSAACLAVCALCFLGLYYYFKRRERAKIQKEEEDEEAWELKYWPRRFNYQDLWIATNGFSKERLLGFGGFGKVYRGTLPCSISGRTDESSRRGAGKEEEEMEEVAVKCVSHDSKQGLREFMAEISSMGRLQHRSLVPMKGWCRKGNELMLVYAYMPNGNLGQWLFPDTSHDRPALGWEARRQVLVDVSEALLYLHQGWEQVVLHRDVKCSNVLLDSDMRGRLGDFGLAKLHERGAAPCSTRVVGTIGYLAPEMALSAVPAAAADVYSFGVVALEVACGRRPIERADRVEDEDWVLVDWVREMYEEGRLLDAADRRLQSPPSAEVELVLKLGLACCHPDPEQRPTMKEVVELLLAADCAAAPEAVDDGDVGSSSAIAAN